MKNKKPVKISEVYPDPKLGINEKEQWRATEYWIYRTKKGYYVGNEDIDKISKRQHEPFKNLEDAIDAIGAELKKSLKGAVTFYDESITLGQKESAS